MAVSLRSILPLAEGDYPTGAVCLSNAGRVVPGDAQAIDGLLVKLLHFVALYCVEVSS